MVKPSTVRKTSAYKAIKPNPKDQFQDRAAQAAAAAVKAEMAKLKTIPGPTYQHPRTDAEVDAVLARVAAPQSNVVQFPAKKPLTFWQRFENVFVYGLSSAICFVFWVIVLREAWGLAPLLWSLTGEFSERALAIWQG